jgi:hypothetical protein
MFTVQAKFVRHFKIGDNINSNLETLRLLYEVADANAKNAILLRKPITIILVSIAEAMLYDFIGRIQSIEHVNTLPAATVGEVKTKKYTKLTHFIAGARKHNLLSADQDFYDQLDVLADLRNRIHIQDAKKSVERDERAAFSAKRQREAEEVVEYIAKYFAEDHPRSQTTYGYVADFEFPWAEHYGP